MSPLALSQKHFKRAANQRAVQFARIRARYDAAQTTAGNRKHWAMADGLSADAANNPGVLAVLRQRATYEIENNTYAKGMTETIANDTIGTGPRPQIRLPQKAAARELESEFRAWLQAVYFTESLRVMRKAGPGRGESFAVRTTNKYLPTPVKLDYQIIEADRCTSPGYSWEHPVDGIELDEFNRPAAYHFLKDHPGDTHLVNGLNATFRVYARDVIHYFRKDRPDQHRGIPEITAALPLFAMLRRYTLAVLDAAETAANHALFIKTGAPASVNADDVDGDAWEEFDVNRNSVTALPHGYEPFQLKAEQPGTTFKEFKGEILNEIARCLNIPFNIAAGNSSGYNYSSGRLDHQTYYKSIDVERSHIEAVILVPVFNAWLAEALITPDALTPGTLAALESVNNRPGIQWHWDGMRHVDPAKEATAQATRLANKTTTWAREFADQGEDWEEQFEQMAVEQKRANELGLVLVAPPAAPVGQTANVVDDEDEQGGNEDEA